MLRPKPRLRATPSPRTGLTMTAAEAASAAAGREPGTNCGPRWTGRKVFSPGESYTNCHGDSVIFQLDGNVVIYDSHDTPRRSTGTAQYTSGTGSRRTAPAGDRQLRDTSRLVGRDAELRQIEATLGALASGTGGFLEITGDPGFGKTRLLTEIRARARRHRMTALAGGAGTGAGFGAFQLFTDALDDHLARRTERHELPADILESLGPMLPAACPWGATVWEAQPAGDQQEIVRALRRLLGLLAADGMVLTLDDVHLADASSLAVLGYLVRHPVPAPLVVAVAYRPRQAALRLRSLLAAGAEHGGVRKLTLGPLGLPDAAELLGPEVPRHRMESVYRDAAGNPRYLLTLARQEVTRRASTGAPAGSAGRLEALLLTELDGLSTTEMAVAAAAAVLGEQFTLDSLVAVSGLDGPGVSAGLDALMHRDLVRPLSGPVLSFRDQLIAKAVYTIVHPVWRVEAHRRALSWASDNGGAAAECARHAARSAATWSPEVHALLYQAATTCLYTSPGEASDWLRVILDLLPSTGARASHRAEVTYLLATALGLMGQFERSRDLLHGLLVSAQAGSAATRLSVVTLCARMARMLGQRAEAAALLRREIRRPADEDSGLVAALRVEAAATAIVTGDPSAARTHAASSVAAARSTGRDVVLAGSLAMLALAQAYDTELAPGSDVDEVAAIADGMSDLDLLPQVETLARLGLAELMLERLPAAERHLRRGEAIARRAGHCCPLVSLSLCLSRLYLMRGPLDTAARWAEQAEYDAMEAGLDDLATIASAVRSVALLGAGAQDALARRAAGDCPFPLPRHRDNLVAREAMSALASAAVTLGASEFDARFLPAVADPADTALLPAAVRARHLEWRTRTALAAGDLAAAEAHLAGAALAAKESGLAGQRGYWLRAEAAVLNARSAEQDTNRLLADSSACFAAAGLRIDQARVDLALAVTLRRRGRLAEAVQAAERAADTSALGGALSLHASADQLCRTLRATAGHPGTDIFGALTERESEIARLVGDGGTSRQVAQHLHLSTRTVETHLARIYRKLNLSSRSALARLVEREVYGTTLPGG